MQAAMEVVPLSVENLPVVCIYEKDPSGRVAVLYVPVRTDYGESNASTVARAVRIAQALTLELALKKEPALK